MPDQDDQTRNVDNQDVKNEPALDVDAKVQSAIDKRSKEAADAERIDKVKKNAGYYARHPEEYADLQKELASINPEVANPALKKIEQLELENARAKAMRKFGLDDDDEELLTATTPEGVIKQAQKLRAKFDAVAAKKTSTKHNDDDDSIDDDEIVDDDDDEPVNNKKSTSKKTSKIELPDYKGEPKDEVKFWEDRLRRISR